MTEVAQKPTINYNDPNILIAYQNQLLKPYELTERADRFLVGKKGGILYYLFGRESIDTTTDFYRINSLRKQRLLKDLFNSREEYIDFALEYARKKGFEGVCSYLTTAGPRESKNLEISTIPKDGLENITLLDLGIGTTTIGSIEDIHRFYEMIKDGTELEEKKEQIVSKVKFIM